jgi:hypothetical protein
MQKDTVFMGSGDAKTLPDTIQERPRLVIRPGRAWVEHAVVALAGVTPGVGLAVVAALPSSPKLFEPQHSTSSPARTE